jgi:hypothetical protein
MVKENLETKVKNAVIRIEKKLIGIYDVLRDLSLKLCHVIRSKKDYYCLPDDKYRNTSS